MKKKVFGVLAAVGLVTLVVWLCFGPLRYAKPESPGNEPSLSSEDAEGNEEQLTSESQDTAPPGQTEDMQAVERVEQGGVEPGDRSDSSPKGPISTPVIFQEHSGVVEVIGSRIRPMPDGSEIGEQLLRTPGKYPYMKVEFSPSGQRPSTVMIADHVLVQFANGVTQQEVQETIQQEGYSIRKKLIHEGLYLIATDEPTLDAVPEMVSRLRARNAVVEMAEPDYVHFPR